MSLLGGQDLSRVCIPQAQELFCQNFGKARQQCRLHHRHRATPSVPGVRGAQLLPALLDLVVKEQGDTPEFAAVILVDMAHGLRAVLPVGQIPGDDLLAPGLMPMDCFRVRIMMR